MGNPAHLEKENKMHITCNVCLVLASPAKAKLVRLESIDITQRVMDESDRLTTMDITTYTVAQAVLTEFKDEHPELAGAGLTFTTAVKVW